MNTFDAFDEHVRSWLDDQAAAEIPASLRDRAFRVTAGRSPRPMPLARIGDHWVVGTGSATWPAFKPVLALVALLAAITIVSVVALGVARRPPAPPPGPDGRLLFDRDGDIVMANVDGSGVRIIVDGEPASDRAGPTIGLEPTAWAPDGAHFVYDESSPDGDTIHIADASGRRVGSFKIAPPDAGSGGLFRPVRDRMATSGRTWWSPDSTMLAVFPLDASEVTIYGLDGEPLTSLPLPLGYGMFREFGLNGWTPDSRSVLAIITSREVGLRPQVWELPLDRAQPQQVPNGHPYTNPGWDLSPDSGLFAFSGHINLDGSAQYAAEPAEGADTIYVADGSGGNQRQVGETHFAGGVGGPQWSPDGRRILYMANWHDRRYELRTVDVATGADRLVARVLGSDFAAYSWAPSGDAILIGAFAVEPGVGRPQPPQREGGNRADRDAQMSLWRVDPTGTAVEMIAEGVNAFDVPR